MSASARDDLLVRFRAGDPQAFQSLVSELGPRLKGFFLRQGAREDEAEDLLQSVFLRVLQGLDRYQPSGQLSAYFLRIARNLWIDHRRRKRPQTGVEMPEAAAATEGPEEHAETQDRAALLRRALAALDPAARELLEFAVLQKLPYKDVADLLGIPVGTVKSRVYYTLRRLREQLPELAPSSEVSSNPEEEESVGP
ncbi:MAG: sigma-70 family RNA polymerase sigma factor [Planctomycetota bacterium]|nr:MAG: sigma-70 family RNA polymerase sigma factor [Planctomycetota bacterium]